MKYLILALSLIITGCASHIAFAEAAPNQIEMTAVCENNEILLKQLKDMYGEDLVMIGENAQSNGEVFTTIWANQETMTWSVVISNKTEEISCLITGGKNFNILVVPDSVSF